MKNLDYEIKRVNKWLNEYLTTESVVEDLEVEDLEVDLDVDKAITIEQERISNELDSLLEGLL